MKENLNDMKYLLNELREVLVKFRHDIPEDTYKLLFDLVYHSQNTLLELEENINDWCIKTRNDC